jgi:hypothetical protein
MHFIAKKQRILSMDINEDKLRALLDSYNVQQRECGDLQVQIEQKEAEIQMKTKHIDKAKRILDGDLKAELISHQKDETKLQENLKNLEREIKLEKMEKNESYLKIVAAEGESSVRVISFLSIVSYTLKAYLLLKTRSGIYEKMIAETCVQALKKWKSVYLMVTNKGMHFETCSGTQLWMCLQRKNSVSYSSRIREVSLSNYLLCYY